MNSSLERTQLTTVSVKGVRLNWWNKMKFWMCWSSEFQIYWNNVIPAGSLRFIVFNIYLLSSALFPLYSHHLLSSFTPLSRVIHCHSWTSRPLSHVAVILRTAGLEGGRRTHTLKTCVTAHTPHIPCSNITLLICLGLLRPTLASFISYLFCQHVRYDKGIF